MAYLMLAGSMPTPGQTRMVDALLLNSLAPNLKPFTDLLGVDEATLKKVLSTWGPGRFDAEIDKDGKATRPDGAQAGGRRRPGTSMRRR